MTVTAMTPPSGRARATTPPRRASVPLQSALRTYVRIVLNNALFRGRKFHSNGIPKNPTKNEVLKMDEMQTMNENTELTIAQECNSVQSTVAESFGMIFQKLSPERIQNADDARALASLSEVVGQRFTMINRRAMYLVYKDELWKDALTITGKPYKNYVDWAKHSFGLASSQAYNVAAVGEYVKEDGSGTVFDIYGNKWDFTKLLTLLQSKELFTRNKEKQYNAVTVPAWEKDLNEEGNQRAEVDKNGDVKPLWKETDDTMPLYALLMLTGAITSRMTVANLKERLRKKWTFDKYGAHGEDVNELKEGESTDEDESTDEGESTGESTGESVTAKTGGEDVGVSLGIFARAILLCVNSEDPNLDKVREYAKHILAIAEKL